MFLDILLSLYVVLCFTIVFFYNLTVTPYPQKLVHSFYPLRLLTKQPLLRQYMCCVICILFINWLIENDFPTVERASFYPFFKAYLTSRSFKIPCHWSSFSFPGIVKEWTSLAGLLDVATNLGFLWHRINHYIFLSLHQRLGIREYIYGSHTAKSTLTIAYLEVEINRLLESCSYFA